MNSSAKLIEVVTAPYLFNHYERGRPSVQALSYLPRWQSCYSGKTQSPQTFLSLSFSSFPAQTTLSGLPGISCSFTGRSSRIELSVSLSDLHVNARSSKSKLHTRLVSPKTRHSPSPAITLKDRHEDIVERMELSRHNYDLLERRKDRHQALPPLLVKPDFLIQPYSVSPSLSCTSPQVKVKRRQANITEAEEGLKALGFEGDWNKRELLRRLDKSKSISPKRDMQVTRKEVHGKQTDLMRYHEKPRLTKTEVMREEAAQYLQEEFRQQLTSGYLQKLHPANSGMVLLGFRGLELA